MILKESPLYMIQRPFKILGIEHIGIAVESLDGLSAIFSDILGLEYTGSEEVTDQQVITDMYETGNSKLEFLKATDENSPVSQFIKKKGGGMHHIALIVDDLQSSLDYLSKEGIQIIDTHPRTGAEGFSVAFLHPKSTGGILIELCEKVSA